MRRCLRRAVHALSRTALLAIGLLTPGAVDAADPAITQQSQPPASFEWTEANLSRVFDGFWEAMDRHYSYFQYKSAVNWSELKAAHRPAALAARNSGELVKTLQAMLAPLQDLHVWIETPEGIVPTHRSTYAFNGNGRIMREAIKQATACGNFALVGRSQPEGFGHLLILRQSTATPDLVRTTLAAMESLRDAPGFLVDLRGANGGSEPLAQEIARWFCAQNTVYARQKFRNGPGHGDFTGMFSRVLTAGTNAYTRPVVCLIGPGTVSSGEGWAKMMQALPHVTTVGLPTRGASGNPQPHALGATGLKVMFSRWVDLMPDGTTFEGRGIPPAVRVDEPPSAYADRDPTLEKAWDILRGKLKAARRP